MSDTAPVPASSSRPIPEIRGAGVLFALLALLALSTLLDVFFFTGYYASDDREYFFAGRLLDDLQLQTEGESVGFLRLTMSTWIALAINLGADVQLVAASFIIFHQLLNIAVFWLGRVLSGNAGGLLAAYLLGTTPLCVYFSSMILPDILLSLFIVPAVALFQFAYLGERGGRARIGLLALSGLLVGLGYLTKESALVLLPFCAAVWLVGEFRQLLGGGASWRTRRAAVVRGVAFVGGFAGVFLLETIVFSLFAGSFVFRLGWAFDELEPGTVSHIARYGLAPLERLEWIPRVLIDQETAEGVAWWQLPFVVGGMVPVWLGLFVITGMVLFPVVLRRYWVIFLAPLWIFVYQTWGTLSFTQYLPPSIKDRYFIPVLALALVVAAAVFWRIVAWVYGRIRKPAGRGLFAVVMVAPLLILPLVFLGYLDHHAGTYSRADRVGPAVEIVTRALESTDGPVIVSGTVARLLYPWQEHVEDEQSGATATQPAPADRSFRFVNHPRLIKSINVNAERLRGLTAQGPVPFVEMDEVYLARRESFFRPSTLDQQIRYARTPEIATFQKPRIPIPQPNAAEGTIPGVVETQPAATAPNAGDDGEPLPLDFSAENEADLEGYAPGVPLTSRRAPEADFGGLYEPPGWRPRFFRYGEYQFIAAPGVRAYQPQSRFARARALFLREPLPTPANDYGSAAKLWWLDRPPVAPEKDADKLAPKEYDLTPDFEEWGLARLDEGEAIISERDDQKIDVTLELEPQDYGWILPKRGSEAKGFFIPPYHRAVMEVRATIADEARAIFIFDIGTVGEGDVAEVRDSKRHVLKDGQPMHFFALGGPYGLTIDPSFRIQGNGRVFVELFAITLYPE